MKGDTFVYSTVFVLFWGNTQMQYLISVNVMKPRFTNKSDPQIEVPKVIVKTNGLHKQYGYAAE